MSRRHIVAFVTIAVVMVIAGALVYEAFDIHDPKPFPIDPEFLLMMFSGLLMVCLSTAVLAVNLLGFYLLLSELLSRGVLDLTRVSWHRYQVFDAERLLFSPPLSAPSLRV
jgi:hypothetical protein